MGCSYCFSYNIMKLWFRNWNTQHTFQSLESHSPVHGTETEVLQNSEVKQRLGTVYGADTVSIYTTIKKKQTKIPHGLHR